MWAQTTTNSNRHLSLIMQPEDTMFALICILSISLTMLANCCLASPMATIVSAQNTISSPEVAPPITATTMAALEAQQQQQQQQQQQRQHQHRESKGIFKRSFAGLGCLGIYDKAKFARLDRVCEECYTLYREPDIHTSCR